MAEKYDQPGLPGLLPDNAMARRKDQGMVSGTGKDQDTNWARIMYRLLTELEVLELVLENIDSRLKEEAKEK